MFHRSLALAALLLVVDLSGSRAQDVGPKPKAATLKKYDDVITKEAKTSPGVFAVHRIEDRIYFEIPATAWDHPMLWQAEVAKGPSGMSWGGMALGSKVLRWERRGHKVYLWQIGFSKRGDGKADPDFRRVIQHGQHHLQLQRRGRGQGSLDRHPRHAAVHHRRDGPVGEGGGRRRRQHRQ